MVKSENNCGLCGAMVKVLLTKDHYGNEHVIEVCICCGTEFRSAASTEVMKKKYDL